MGDVYAFLSQGRPSLSTRPEQRLQERMGVLHTPGPARPPHGPDPHLLWGPIHPLGGSAPLDSWSPQSRSRAQHLQEQKHSLPPPCSVEAAFENKCLVKLTALTVFRRTALWR